MERERETIENTTAVGEEKIVKKPLRYDLTTHCHMHWLV